MIFAQGARFGGHAPFVKEGRLHYVYNYLGIPPEYDVAAPVSLTGRHVVGAEFALTGRGENLERVGMLTLYVAFTGGEIVTVVFDVADDAYVDVERHLAAAVARD